MRYEAAVDFSVVDIHRMQRRICHYVHGKYDPRTVPVTRKQIRKWFCGSPEAFVDAELDKCVEAGLVAMVRTSPNRKRTGYVYELTQKGRDHYPRGWWAS